MTVFISILGSEVASNCRRSRPSKINQHTMCVSELPPFVIFRVPDIQSPYRTPDVSMTQSMHGGTIESAQPVYEARDYYG